jgi:N-acetylmuramoyl-L-alanine amidase
MDLIVYFWPSHATKVHNYHIMRFAIILILLFPLSGKARAFTDTLPYAAILKDKIIALDPGHGGTALTDSFRVGPSGEREEWINLRVGLELKSRLEHYGAKVIISRTEDTHVELVARAEQAMLEKADIFISIHHNATADRSVNFPIIYFHGSAIENPSSIRLARCVGEAFIDHMFTEKQSEDAVIEAHSIRYQGVPLNIVSDYTIFPKRGAMVLRGTYGIPSIIAEASFFSNAAEEQRLKSADYNSAEVEAYLQGITRFFTQWPAEPTQEKKAPLEISPFTVFEQADRMKPEALLWKTYFSEAFAILKKIDPLKAQGLSAIYLGKSTPPLRKAITSKNRAALDNAWQKLETAVRSFPDAYLARACHAGRIRILQLTGKDTEAAAEWQRIQAFYPID